MISLPQTNDSELRALLQDLRLPYYTPREDMELFLIGRQSKTASVNYPEPSLIERWRYYIMDWAAKNWEDIYYQIECPLQQDGCITCPDFIVASCLVRNRHIFKLDKEVEYMPKSWTALMVSIIKSNPTQAAAILREAANENYGESKGNRIALMKIATAVLDIIEGSAKPITAYMGMNQAAFSDGIKELVDSSPTVSNTLISLADMLDAGEAVLPTKTEKKTETKTKEKSEDKYYPAVQDTRAVSTLDDDDDDLDTPVKPADEPPLPLRQDASKFAKEPAKVPSPSDLKEISKEPAPAKETITNTNLLRDIREIVRDEIRAALTHAANAIAVVFADTHPKPSKTVGRSSKNKDAETIPEMDGDDDD